jgi:hypothetical protein
MASMLTTTTTPSRDDERDAIDLARLDDDGGARSEVPAVLTLRVEIVPLAPDDHFPPRMIPGAREPGTQVRFGAPPVTVYNSPCTMDAATIAARQREGGGAPSERRPPGERSMWGRLARRLRQFLTARDRSAGSASTLSHR